MEEYDWCMVPRISNGDFTMQLNANATNESDGNWSPDKQSSSSVEVIYDDEETLNDTSKSSENLAETLSEIQSIDDDEDEPERESLSSVEHPLENNSGNRGLENLLENTTLLREPFRNETPRILGSNKKVIKRKATDSGNHNKVKKIRINVDKLISRHIEDIVTLLSVLAAFICLVSFFCAGGSNSRITDAIAELKEENKLIKEELSNFMKNEKSTRNLFLQKLVEKLHRSFPSRKEFNNLNEQVKNLSDSIKLQDQILERSNIGKNAASKVSYREMVILSSHLGKFSDVISALHKELYPENYKSQENPTDDDPCSVFRFKPSNFSKIILDKSESFNKILKDLQNEDLTTIVSTQISVLKSFGHKGVTFMKNAFLCIDKVFTQNLHPEKEIKKRIENIDELLVKWKLSQKYVIKDKK